MAHSVRTLIWLELVMGIFLSTYTAGFAIHPDSIYRRLLFGQSLDPEYQVYRDIERVAKRDSFGAEEVPYAYGSDYDDSFLNLGYPEDSQLDFYDAGDGWGGSYPVDKRAISIVGRSRMPVAFHCTPFSAKCRNGGIGPKITPTKKGKAICVCLCPQGYRGAQCTKFKRP